jgi:hypothetical protein
MGAGPRKRETAKDSLYSRYRAFAADYHLRRLLRG